MPEDSKGNKTFESAVMLYSFSLSLGDPLLGTPCKRKIYMHKYMSYLIQEDFFLALYIYLKIL